MCRLLLLAFLLTPQVLGLGIPMLKSNLTVNLPLAGATKLPNYLPTITNVIGNFTAVGINKTETNLSELHNMTKTGVEMLTGLRRNKDEEFREMYNRFATMVIGMSDEAKNSAVDCFGLGKMVAKTLEFVFQAQASGPDALDVQFSFSSSKQPKRVIVPTDDQFGLEWTDFDITRLTVIIVHGFMSSSNESWVKDMEDAFHHWDDVNVLAVDWSAGGNTLNYVKAAANTKVAGVQIAKILEQIANYTLKKNPDSNKKWGEIHCVGHSLGAHICGVAANEFKQTQPFWKINRITGLDPAQPCFKSTDNALKLDNQDADFIDVIHTNAKSWWQLGFGLPNTIGHMDFYPNGGRLQPGCAITYSSVFDYVKLPTAVVSKAICSHGRSYIYFTESIVSARNCSFIAQPWDHSLSQALKIINMNCTLKKDYDCVEMGINSVTYPQRGSFLTLTSTQSPYCNVTEADIEESRTVLKEDLKNAKGMDRIRSLENVKLY